MRYCNPMKSLAGVFTLLLMTSGASAQAQRPHPRPQGDMRPTQHKSGPPPTTIAPPPPQMPASPFAARPDTYAPHYDSPPPRPRYRGDRVPISGGVIGIGGDVTLTPPPDVTAPGDESTLLSPFQPQGLPRLSPSTIDTSKTIAARGPDTF